MMLAVTSFTTLITPFLPPFLIFPSVLSSSLLSYSFSYLPSFSPLSSTPLPSSSPLSFSPLFPSSIPPFSSLIPSPLLPLHIGTGNDILTIREDVDTGQPILIIRQPHLLDLSDEELDDLNRIEVALFSPNGGLDSSERIVLMNDGSFAVSHSLQTLNT